MYDERVVTAAVTGGRLGVLRWGAQFHGWALVRTACELAARGGSLDQL